MITQQTQHEYNHAALLKGLRAHLQPLTGDAHQYDQLLAQIGRERFALFGVASHGTIEFYRERAEITKRLITERGFTAVAVEADWPNAWHVNHYVRGLIPRMSERVQWIAGQPVRQQYAHDEVLVGFGIHLGWGGGCGPSNRKAPLPVATARPGCAALVGGVTVAAACHRCGLSRGVDRRRGAGDVSVRCLTSH